MASERSVDEIPVDAGVVECARRSTSDDVSGADSESIRTEGCDAGLAISRGKGDDESSDGVLPDNNASFSAASLFAAFSARFSSGLGNGDDVAMVETRFEPSVAGTRYDAVRCKSCKWEVDEVDDEDEWRWMGDGGGGA